MELLTIIEINQNSISSQWVAKLFSKYSLTATGRYAIINLSPVWKFKSRHNGIMYAVF
jgi:hypothetical protein